MKWLTKSNYKNYLIHPAFLWLAKHDPDRLPPFDERAQAMVDQGNEIDVLAQQLYPDGVAADSDLFAGIDDTAAILARASDKHVFQPAVLTERKLYARADIVSFNEDGSWDITEVKSGTSVRPDHIADLAFQKVAFEEAGYRITRSFVTHINNQYVRQGAVELDKLFVTHDVTAQVDALLGRTRQNITAALAVMALPDCPDDDPTLAGNWYAWRDVYRHLHPDLPADSIYNLTRLDLPQLRALAKAGVTTLADIPADFELKPPQAAQLAAIRAGEPVIHPVKIAEHMRKLVFPLYFFDYETVGPAVPLYDGTRPYAQVPFQYSLHILGAASAKLEHHEFLATDSKNPMPALLAQMQADIGEQGSVVVWYKAFEGGVNQMMAGLYPESAEFLRGVNRRMYDLMEIFSNFYYSDARFGGSASIKNVLPVLVPELSYKDLAIGKGDVAQRQWEQAVQGKLEPDQAAQVFNDLKIYCGQDTLAMVRIYEFLMNVKETAPGAQLSLLG
jgi:hypothetical protein